MLQFYAGRTRNNGGVSPVTPVIVGNTPFVSKQGDDATAQRESLNTHYLTIQAAIDDAQSGDSIIVYSGVYNEALIFDNKNVSLYLNSNATIQGPISIENNASVTIEGGLLTTAGGDTSINTQAGTSLKLLNLSIISSGRALVLNDFFEITDCLIQGDDPITSEIAITQSPGLSSTTIKNCKIVGTSGICFSFLENLTASPLSIDNIISNGTIPSSINITEGVNTELANL